MPNDKPDQTGITGGPQSGLEGSKRPTKKTKTRPERKPTRAVRTFPASTFEEALTLGNAIQQFAAGQRVRRITLFDNLQKSPDSGPSRQLITNSSKYGVTQGGYQAEHLELTPDGKIATSAEVSPRDQLAARFRLGIEGIAPFKALYERFKGNKLPAQPVLRDYLAELGNHKDELSECIDTFILNAKFLGLLKTIAGAERLLTIDHAYENLNDVPPISGGFESIDRSSARIAAQAGLIVVAGNLDWSKTCFYITPIGEPDSEQRKHSDLFLSSIVEPALEEFGLKVVRADQIGKPGMITKQVIEYVIRARLVVADLSFHNPNVFYELSLRHACRLPTVQLIRVADPLPFDLDQFRTVKIDTTDIYTLVPSLDTYKSEIATHVRRALSDPDVDNPLTVFCPDLRVAVPGNGAK